MAGKSPKKVPRFFGLRIYLSSTILYYWLVMPFLLILILKYAPNLTSNDKIVGANQEEALDSGTGLSNRSLIPYDQLSAPEQAGDTLDKGLKSEPGTPALPQLESGDQNQKPPVIPEANVEDESQLAKVINLMFNLTLISFFIGFLFNLPFKRYFKKKRNNKKINKKLHSFCKRFLLKSPLINASILGITYLVTHVYMFTVLVSENAFSKSIERGMFTHFFYISLIASVLALVFVYLWEKHRVHIRYIEHIYSDEELRKRIFNLKVGRIRNRMFLSSTMTTMLPLTIVMLYLFLSVTYLRDLPYEAFSDEQRLILFGTNELGNELGKAAFSSGDSSLKIPEWAFYINVINSGVMFIGIIASIFIAFVYIMFLVKWTTQDIVHPVKELLENMRMTGQGELEHYSIVRTNDEIGELTEGYNDMTQKIGDYIHNISRMTDAYSRFVPRQFLDFLGKKTFVDIRLGDQVEKEMTVMFSDIRHFTDISEQMTPKENFDFLNYYLGYMEPVIRNNNGFIDKYIGDSIMALFGDNAEDAINASIEMRIKLSQFNQVMDQFNKPTINSGIGIHSGSLMLGVVGGEGRMDGTVISDAVNLAARLEGLTKLYGSAIIISQDTLIRLNNPSQYNYRFLDIVKVKGKKEAVYIFEILDGDSDDIRQLKIKTKLTFADGINAYKLGKFEDAMKAFTDVYAKNHHDVTAKLYISRCKRFIDHGVPDDWDGIERISWN